MHQGIMVSEDNVMLVWEYHSLYILWKDGWPLFTNGAKRHRLAVLPENAIMLRPSFLRRYLTQNKTNVNCWALWGCCPGPKWPYWPWPASPRAFTHALPMAQGSYFSLALGTQPCPELHLEVSSCLLEPGLFLVHPGLTPCLACCFTRVWWSFSCHAE